MFSCIDTSSVNTLPGSEEYRVETNDLDWENHVDIADLSHQS